MAQTYPIRFASQLRPHLKSLRKKRGLTQAQAGALVGVSQARMAEIEANPGLVSFEQLMQIFSALNVSVSLMEVLPSEKNQLLEQENVLSPPFSKPSLEEQPSGITPSRSEDETGITLHQINEANYALEELRDALRPSHIQDKVARDSAALTQLRQIAEANSTLEKMRSAIDAASVLTKLKAATDASSSLKKIDSATESATTLAKLKEALDATAKLDLATDVIGKRLAFEQMQKAHSANNALKQLQKAINAASKFTDLREHAKKLDEITKMRNALVHKNKGSW